MSEAKHTKGPWKILDCESSDMIYSECGTREHEIAHIPYYEGDADDEAEANTFLIAAAPEMYEALKEEAEALRSESEILASATDRDIILNVKGRKKHVDERIAKIQAVIAKAEVEE